MLLSLRREKGESCGACEVLRKAGCCEERDARVKEKGEAQRRLRIEAAGVGEGG